MILFSDLFQSLRKGRANDEATRQVAEVMRAVAETGKAGEITVKLRFKPEAGDSGHVKIAATVTSKAPRPELPEAIFYMDRNGGLHRDDPDQGLLIEGDLVPRGSTARRPAAHADA